MKKEKRKQLEADIKQLQDCLTNDNFAQYQNKKDEFEAKLKEVAENVIKNFSFPTLKDPAHDSGPSKRHTAEVLAWADWSSVAEFAEGGAEARPAERLRERGFELGELPAGSAEGRRAARGNAGCGAILDVAGVGRLG